LNESSPPVGPVEAQAEIAKQLAGLEPSTRRRVIEKFVLAALGSIPWIGGFLSAVGSLKAEAAGVRQDSLQSKWLEEHESKIAALRSTLEDISRRFENLGPAIDERLQSEDYLVLVRKAFRLWDASETKEKQKYAANAVVNSAGTRVCSDDVVRLFLDWLTTYHESHFAVIREIFKTPNITRFDIWAALYGQTPREDSAEADLFKLLIRELSMGGVIRQERETNYAGQFVRRTRPTRTGDVSSTMESAFEDSKPYVLTELGKQFVHYTMNEVVGRLEGGS